MKFSICQIEGVILIFSVYVSLKWILIGISHWESEMRF